MHQLGACNLGIHKEHDEIYKRLIQLITQSVVFLPTNRILIAISSTIGFF